MDLAKYERRYNDRSRHAVKKHGLNVPSPVWSEVDVKDLRQFDLVEVPMRPRMDQELDFARFKQLGLEANACRDRANFANWAVSRRIGEVMYLHRHQEWEELGVRLGALVMPTGLETADVTSV